MATEPELSLQYAQQAYQLLPQHPQIIDTYGWALSQNRQPERGLGILRDAEIRDPANITIQLHLAGTLKMLKREAEAQQIFTTLAGKPLSKTEQQLLQQLQKN
jgi:cytochrome c-type biogenesis protein CcmH/NrfG